MFLIIFLVMQLQFSKFSELFKYAAAVFFFPELILHKYSVEGYTCASSFVCTSPLAVTTTVGFLDLRKVFI